VLRLQKLVIRFLRRTGFPFSWVLAEILSKRAKAADTASARLSASGLIGFSSRKRLLNSSSSFIITFRHRPEALLYLAHSPCNRTGADTQDRRRIVLRHVLCQDEQGRFLEVGLQPVQGQVQPADLPVAVRPVGCVVPLDDRIPILHRARRPLPSPVVPAGVHHHLIEPGREPALEPEAVEPLVDAQEDLLGEIGGLFAPAAQSQAPSRDPGMMAAEEPVEELGGDGAIGGAEPLLLQSGATGSEDRESRNARVHADDGNWRGICCLCLGETPGFIYYGHGDDRLCVRRRCVRCWPLCRCFEHPRCGAYSLGAINLRHRWGWPLLALFLIVFIGGEGVSWAVELFSQKL